MRALIQSILSWLAVSGPRGKWDHPGSAGSVGALGRNASGSGNRNGSGSGPSEKRRRGV